MKKLPCLAVALAGVLLGAALALSWSVTAQVSRAATGAMLMTEQATASGTAKDFTGIPASAKRITVMLEGVMSTGAIAVQIGDSGGVEATDYVSATGYIQNVSTTAVNGFDADGFQVLRTANEPVTGTMTLTLKDAANNTWVVSGVLGGDSITQSLWFIGGAKSLSGALDRVRLATIGAGAFNGGSVNVMYER